MTNEQAYNRARNAIFKIWCDDNLDIPDDEMVELEDALKKEFKQEV